MRAWAIQTSSTVETMAHTPACSICFDSLLSHLSPSPTVSSLPCGHVFHESCVKQWVATHYDCPQCRCPASIPCLSPLFLTHQDSRNARSTITDTYRSTSSSRGIVLDVLQTQLEDLGRENKHIRRKLEETRKEKENEAEQFQIKVKELQEKFREVERKVKEKDVKIKNTNNRGFEDVTLTKMNILKQENKYLGQELYKKCQQLEELQTHLKLPPVDAESLYESLNFEKCSEERKKSCCKQCCSCLRCSVVILFSVALVIVLAFVLPLKILFGEES